jgi:DNA mismatch repair protein MSH4
MSLTKLEEYDLQLELKYESARQFYIKIPMSELDGRDLPPIFTNIIRRKNNIECQTLELMKRNQKVIEMAHWLEMPYWLLQINVSHQEVILMSAHVILSAFLLLTIPGDQAVENLIEEVRSHMSIMFKICEAVGLLDMVCYTSMARIWLSWSR